MVKLMKILFFLLTTSIPANSEQFKLGNAKFAQEFYSVFRSASSNDSNFIYSPLSLSACVGLLAVGANGRTLTELQNVLHLPNNETELLIELKDLFNSVQNSSTATVQIANGMFPNLRFRIHDQYLEKSVAYFKAQVQQVDYTDTFASAKHINTYVENATNKNIKNIVSSRDLSASTELILVNALYFNSAWKTPFPKRYTERMKFYSTLPDGIEVDMMQFGGHLPYADVDELDAEVVALPYKDNRFNMLVILPKARDGITALENKLRAIDLGKLHNKLELRLAYVFIPKFKVESEINLKSSLEMLGAGSVFHDYSADLSRIANSSLFYVDKIVQKVYLKVDEDGTEAAAATKVVGVNRILVRVPPRFMADHPFIIILQYTSEGFADCQKDGQCYETPNPNANETASMLFMGRVMNPNSA